LEQEKTNTARTNATLITVLFIMIYSFPQADSIRSAVIESSGIITIREKSGCRLLLVS